MFEFRDIEIEDIAFFEHYWITTGQRASDYSFPILWGWARDYGYQAAQEENGSLLWIRQTVPGNYNLAPLGQWERDDWAETIEKRFGKEPEFWLVPEKLMSIWKLQLGDRMKVEDMRGSWEYLYDIRDLAALPGNRYMRKRNRVNQFRKNYDYLFKPITDEIIPHVMEFQHSWCQANNGCAEKGLIQENHGILRILSNWHKIPRLVGGIIEVSGKIAAYTIGELACHTIFVHFEKASLEYGAAYQVINKEFMSHMLGEHPELAVVNREEDMNDPGLREAKMSYMPMDFVRKYRVKIKF
ncbi:MAG: phosphatidylglycerol lysyltransferase domain-containing protein [Synergistaceae bacterium]|nr:phosphatidylglycerol lysyltransferase domain-containing protein [Synergistaceae bacterium]